MADDQGMWRLVHEVAARSALDGRQITDLRWWAYRRSLGTPGSVFDTLGDGAVRPSFRDALTHAAGQIVAGREPEE